MAQHSIDTYTYISRSISLSFPRLKRIMALLVGNIAAVFSFFLAGNADATGINNYLDGTWSGTETCFQHCDFNGPGGSYSPGKVQGTVEARLTLKNGSGVYIVGNEDPGNLAVATEFVNGDFAAGHIVTDGERHGTFQVLANETHLYGTWMTYASKRSFRWLVWGSLSLFKSLTSS